MTISCIGTGAMGGAIMRAVCKNFDVSQIKVTDKNTEMGKKFASENGCSFVASNKEVLSSKYIFLAVKPQFLILDEVTAGLDLLSTEAVLTLLREYQTTHDCAYLLITHDLSAASRLCSRLLEIDHGHIIHESVAQ